MIRQAMTETVCVQPECRAAARKDGEPLKPGNMWNQHWVCANGHRWTSGWFDTTEHEYEEVANPASHLLSRHSLMVSSQADAASMLRTHQRQHRFGVYGYGHGKSALYRLINFWRSVTRTEVQE